MNKKRSLKEEKEIWYKKLKDEGFDDIEYADGSLRSASPRTDIQKDPLVRAATEEYYYMATQFMHNYKFKNERERIIWEYHANGISVRNTSKLLAEVKIKVSPAVVGKLIQKLRIIMKHEFLLGYENLQ